MVRRPVANVSLPLLTRICARGANRIGAFGLVGRAITIAYHGLACAGGRRLVGLDPVTNRYQSPDLALLPPRETFTNHYHRDGGLGIDVSVGVEVRWHGSRVNVM
jgi:hypothetical protein